MTEEVLDLLARQLASWPALAAAHADLARARYADHRIDGWSLRVQCNPGRIRSNRARVDAAAISARPCFLCCRNRPAEQEGLAWGKEWLILANPAPIFPAHFTLVHRPHGPRRVEEMLPALCDLARDMAPGLSLFYNGPRSGASAPDHFHFQAYTRGWLATEEEMLGPAGEPATRAEETFVMAGLPARLVATAGRTVIVLRSAERDPLLRALAATLARLPAAAGGEPDLNLVCRHEGGRWGVLIFPRAAHRPRCYHASHDEALLVSPGAADMAGLLVVTRERDLERLDERVLTQIYGEVSAPFATVAAALAAGGTP